MSLIKWHLPHSIHGEHRGRTQKCPIANHRVEYSYSKVVPLRIAIDRNSNLAECWIEFEVLQEFNLGLVGGGGIGRDERITLGVVRLNLSEYVEESESILGDGATTPAFRASLTSPPPADGKSASHYHHRKRSSLSGITVGGPDASPRSSHRSDTEEDPRRPQPLSVSDVRDGVVRRYLMQDSKINSTLKLGILMVQVEGDRNFIAPPLKTAPVFGGIPGIVSADALEPVDPSAEAPGQVPSLSNKSRDLSELQDAYRRVLAASWMSQPGELPADQCIEDIFAGGNGFRTADHPTAHGRQSHSHANLQRHHHHHHHHASPSHLHSNAANANTINRTPSTGSSTHRSHHLPRDDSGSVSDDEDPAGGGSNGGLDMMTTIRPRDISRIRHHRMRAHSGSSDKSSRTLLLGRAADDLRHQHSFRHHRRDGSGEGGSGGGLRSRSDSLVSLATTLGSDHGRRDAIRRARELDELEIRDDLVAWTVPESKRPDPEAC